MTGGTQVIPNTEKESVASLAVAWDIVRTTYVTNNTLGSEEQEAERLANEVIKITQALLSYKSIPSK